MLASKEITTVFQLLTPVLLCTFFGKIIDSLVSNLIRAMTGHIVDFSATVNVTNSVESKNKYDNVL